MTAPLTRLTIYTKHMDAMVAFYETHFGFTALHDPQDRIVELQPRDGGAILQLHPAGKAQKMGQVLVKLCFDVEDIEGFCARAAEHGLMFSRPHKADGYRFANAKDPSGNSISITSRAFRR